MREGRTTRVRARAAFDGRRLELRFLRVFARGSRIQVHPERAPHSGANMYLGLESAPAASERVSGDQVLRTGSCSRLDAAKSEELRLSGCSPAQNSCMDAALVKGTFTRARTWTGAGAT